MGEVVNAAFWPLYSRERNLLPIAQEARWNSGLFWTSMENLIPTDVRTPDLPIHSELLYRPCYPSCRYVCTYVYTCMHAFTHTHTHTDIHTQPYTHMYILTHM
jgi:hypothetical protein